MLDDDTTSPVQPASDPAAPPARRPRRRAASRPAGPPAHVEPTSAEAPTSSDDQVTDLPAVAEPTEAEPDLSEPELTELAAAEAATNEATALTPESVQPDAAPATTAAPVTTGQFGAIPWSTETPLQGVASGPSIRSGSLEPEGASQAAAQPPPAKKATSRRSTRRTASKRSAEVSTADPSDSDNDPSQSANARADADAGRAESLAEASDQPPVTVAVTEPESETGKPVRRSRSRRASKAAAAENLTEANPAVPMSGDLETTAPSSTDPMSTDSSMIDLPVVDQLNDAQTNDAQPNDAQPNDAQPNDAQPNDAQPNDAQPVEGQPGKDASTAATSPVALVFQAPDSVKRPARRRATRGAGASDTQAPTAESVEAAPEQPLDVSAERIHTDDAPPDDAPTTGERDQGDGGNNRRRRSRGGRNRRKSSGDTDKGSTDTPDATSDDAAQSSGAGQPRDTANDADGADRPDDDAGSSHRRRRRRRSGEASADGADDPTPTVVRVREPRAKKDTISSVEGSTRIEAKKQRRREGREAGRRRPPILSESEFLARRESVERVMAIRQRGEVTQIGVLEDDVLVEHYVSLESQSSLIGNVYLGRVQNVLPSMEAAFIDIGKGRNAVLYAGEVNWDLMGGNNQPRRIENALKPGQAVLVQVSKDPVGHKGARLTSQISLPGRYLVYVPAGGTSGISRKLPDTERTRLKNLLKDILPDSAGVIIRTAAEGASEEELTRDVTRLTVRWEDIEKKVKGGQAPALLYGEPDTTIKVVRDLFTEDFTKLVISGDDAWDMVDGYVQHVAPDLAERLERYDGGGDIFVDLRIEEQIAKALERKVWLPSGGSLVIDRTEAMTVVDVNTGKFTGSGGNLEETVTKNNLEAAEEIVRQLRLRDIGGIIVIDFIDMVLEDNRDLVLRRLVECLGRDRTRHQVAEVTSLGLVQMTRKRISTGLIEAFSHTCEVCQGRGVVIEQEPVVNDRHTDDANGHHPNTPSNGSRGSKRSTSRRRGTRAEGGGIPDALIPALPDPTSTAAADAPAAEPSDPPTEPDSGTTQSDVGPAAQLGQGGAHESGDREQAVIPG